MNFVAVAFGGAAGALARYLCQLAMPPSASHWGATLTVNILGSFIIGVMWALSRSCMSPMWWLLLVTGFLGGFTTFSSFSLDAVRLFEQGQALRALLYVAASVIFSLSACLSAVWLTQRFIKLS
ncbi:MAG: fluoride efflux transporter CrcB [Muribaculaceae bacterium]|nr:fluoride efflux transporter CrcB [Muribaculaceae bacterium]